MRLSALILPVILLCMTNCSASSFPSKKKKESKRRLPEFYLVSDVSDKQVPGDSALIVFKLNNQEFEGLKPGDMEILAGYNETQFPFPLREDRKHALTMAPGTYQFMFYIYGYEEIYSDSVVIKPGHRIEVSLNFREADYPAAEEKPVIYLYPKADKEVSVSVQTKGKLTFTYPEMGTGWKGTAHPDGSITIDDHTYPYLFWEGEDRLSAADIDLKKGFMVTGDNAVAFLEQQLTAMGLNDREQTDFITYWGPRMAANEQQYVHFLFGRSCDNIAELNISPAPDAIYRVFMVWSPVPEGVQWNPEPQTIPAMDRSGYHALEWGGSEIDLVLFSCKTR